MENNKAQNSDQKTILDFPLPPLKKGIILPISITVGALGLFGIILLLGNQNQRLQKEVKNLQMQTPFVQESAIQTDNRDTFIDPLGKYSFKYPRGLFPKVDKEWITFYVDQYYANKKEGCEKKNQGTFEYPCGYGDLIFTISVDTDSKKSEVIILKGVANTENYIDSQNRKWKISPQIPWAGSIFNMNGVDAVAIVGNQTVHVEIVHPEYQYFFNQDVVKAIISSFQLRQ